MMDAGQGGTCMAGTDSIGTQIDPTARLFEHLCGHAVIRMQPACEQIAGLGDQLRDQEILKCARLAGIACRLCQLQVAQPVGIAQQGHQG